MFGGILKGGAVVAGFGLLGELGFLKILQGLGLSLGFRVGGFCEIVLGFVVGASNHGGGCIGLNGALAHTGVYG